MVIVDSSIWIDHLHKGLPSLAERLDAGLVLMHPFVIGEIACGSIKNRADVLENLRHLYQPVIASDEEVLTLIEQRELMGRGICYIDMHLLASGLLTGGARLWTRDRRLKEAAMDLNLAFSP